jgi:Flp pilus assembly pilin Flp
MRVIDRRRLAHEVLEHGLLAAFIAALLLALAVSMPVALRQAVTDAVHRVTGALHFS